MTESTPQSPIHARGVSPAKYKELLRRVNETAGTENEVTWDDLVAQGQCKPTHPERRRAQTAAADRRLLAHKKKSRRRKPTPKRKSVQ